MTNKKILITGSCGFVFSNFLRKIVHDKKKYGIVSIDRVNENTVNSMYWNKDHNFHVADIRDPHIIDTIFKFEQPDIVIHGAAETRDESSFMTSNVAGTQNIINACIKHKVERLMYISTDKVYGQLTHEDDMHWEETDPLKPRSSYAASKAAGELLVQAAHESHGLMYNIIRTPNNYGPRQSMDKLIPKTIKSILNNEPVTIYGGGQQIRSWVHVNDNCSAIMHILENSKPNEIYNIQGEMLSNYNVVFKICKAMSHDISSANLIADSDNRDFMRANYGQKLTGSGWSPSHEFKNSIVGTVEWYKTNKWFLK